MKSILISILFCLLVINTNSEMLYLDSMGGVGAVYTMTNGVPMNQVIIYRLNITGQLTWSGAVNTNGTGVNTTADDPLFSQGAMTVFSNYLFVVNAGSNSLSMFVINQMSATQLTLVSVQSTNGFFPISVTVSARYACVLTGGNQTGIRCFTYNSSGLFNWSHFDRDLTSYISQSVPPMGPAGTLSEILFSPDGLCLIVSVKGYNATSRGYLLFYQNDGYLMASVPTLQRPSNGIFPFSMTLVGPNGLLITDPGAKGVLTLDYSSMNGTITNSILTPINASIAGTLCWSTYSPIVGNYYVISASPAAIVELNLNLTSISNPVEIIQYYPIANNTGALETTVVSVAGMDYLYVIGTTAQVINIYQLNGSGNALFNGLVVIPQQGNMTNIPKIAGIAAYVQITMSSAPDFFRTKTIIVGSFVIFLYFNYVYRTD